MFYRLVMITFFKFYRRVLLLTHNGTCHDTNIDIQNGNTRYSDVQNGNSRIGECRLGSHNVKNGTLYKYKINYNANRQNDDDMIRCDRSSIVISLPIIAAAIHFVALTLSQIIEISHTATMLTAASDSYNYFVVPK